MTKSFAIPTTAGVFTAWISETGLARLEFPERSKCSTEALAPIAGAAALERGWLKLLQSALTAIVQGRPAGELPPLDWSGATAFQKDVWRALLRIPAGETKSYAEIARNIRRPQAARAVGGACGANPVPVLVPCHRVLAANRKIGGFSGGLDWKRRLLATEGVVVRQTADASQK